MRAWWDSQARTVTCTVCRPGGSVPPPGLVAQPDPGEAGASAGREYRRRMQRREARIRAAHPKLAPLLLALSSVPEHESAFERGARGERTVAAGLQRRVAGGSVRLLHDRRMPRGRGNIDHRAVAPTGVYVIDAKAHKGKVRIARPVFGPAQLLINGRDWTRLLDGLDRQLRARSGREGGRGWTADRVDGRLAGWGAGGRVAAGVSGPFSRPARSAGSGLAGAAGHSGGRPGRRAAGRPLGRRGGRPARPPARAARPRPPGP